MAIVELQSNAKPRHYRGDSVSGDGLPAGDHGIGSTITYLDGSKYEYDGDSWNQVATAGANHVTPVGGYAGPEGAPAGEKMSVTQTNGQSGAISGTLIDIKSDPNSANVCFLLLDDGTGPAVVDTSYCLLPGERIRLPITAGNLVNAICDTGETATIWIHPVEGD